MFVKNIFPICKSANYTAHSLRCYVASVDTAPCQMNTFLLVRRIFYVLQENNALLRCRKAAERASFRPCLRFSFLLCVCVCVFFFSKGLKRA